MVRLDGEKDCKGKGVGRRRERRGYYVNVFGTERRKEHNIKL